MSKRGKSYTEVWANRKFPYPLRLYSGEKVPLLKDKDPIENRLRQEQEIHCAVLSLPKDIEEYQDIMEKVASRRAKISQEDRKWNTNTNEFVVFLRWVEVFYRPPNTEE